MDFNHDTGAVFNGLQSLDVSTVAPLGGTAGVLAVNGTGAIVLTTGTTAQRPAGAFGVAGMLRYNSDLAVTEYFNGSSWLPWVQGTVTSVAATGSTGITIGGSPITSAGTITITLDSELGALAGFSGIGFLAHGAAGIWTVKTLTGTPSNITVSNGNGSTGIPTINLAAVTDSGTGSFKKFITDGFGRVTGTTPVVVGDITTLVDATYVNVSGDTMTGVFNAGGFVISGVATPVAGTDAANKNYVDTAVTGLSWKQAVRAASTSPGTLATSYANGSFFDSVTLVTGDRILIKNQVTQTENGIYTVNATGAPTRALDSDTGAELIGESVFVDQGAINSDTGWVQTTNAPITLGSSNIVYSQFSGSGAYAAGSGLTLSGNTFSITAPVSTTLGGTGLTTIGGASQILGVTAGGVGLEYKTVTAGAAISIIPAVGSITIANTGVTSNVAGTGISVSGATGAVTIANTGVLSVTGTVNQVLVNGTSGSATTGTITLTLPQAIGTGSAVQFSNVYLSSLTANGFLYPGSSALQTTAAATNGQILIGSTGASPVAAALTAGTAISIANAAGSITITNTGVSSIVAGTGVSISGAAGAVTVSNTGVTSVALSLPSIFTVSGSPVTTTGTLAGTLASQLSNLVFASPNGSTGVPTFRALASADMPFKLYSESPTPTPTPASASGTNSLALGNGSVSSTYSATTFGGTQITAAGDFLDVKAFFRAITTTATVTELFLDNAGTQRFVLPVNSNVAFTLRVSARRTDASGGAAGYTFEGVIRKDTTAVSTTLVGTPTKNVLGETNTVWDVSVSADSTNGTLKISVTGEAAKTIRWAAVMDAVVVTN